MFTFGSEFIKFHHFTSRKIFFQINQFVFVYSLIPFPNFRQLQRNWVQSLSRVWLCDSTDNSTPGSPVHHQLIMFIKSVMPSNHLILCHPFSSCLQSFSASGSFQISQLFSSGGQDIGASGSTSVLPMNIRTYFL